MMSRVLVSVLFVVVFFIPVVSVAQPTVKVTIQVVDEQGLPVEDAIVGVGFTGARPIGEGWGSSQSNDQDTTDDDGIVVFSSSALGHITYGAIKDGYYRSTDSYAFNGVSGIYGFRKWQPYNPTLTLILKKIVNPVALYARQFTGGFGEQFLEIPKTGRPMAFDLTEGDWVVPHGLGLHRDFVFEFSGDVKSNVEFDVSLKLTFTNEKDGVQIHSAPVNSGSRLRLPHKAPVAGYAGEFGQRFASNPSAFVHKDFPDDRNFFFRVRTETDKNGNIISANYGKIHGNIVFNELGQIGIVYYFNPDANVRNLEFNTGKNLFFPDSNNAIAAPLLP